MRRVFIACAVLLLIPGVAHAGGGGVDTSGCAGYSEGTTVTMLDSCFSGVAHFAPSDTAITVRNDGGLSHTLTAVDGSFDTGQVGPGGSAELRFDEPGIYRVFCGLHGTAAGEGMAGVVVVGEAIPAAVAAPIDTSAIQAVVAEENAAVIDAVDGQREAIQSLRLTELQARLLEALDQAVAEETTSTPQRPVPDSADTGESLVMIAVGLAGGIALAALLAALRLSTGARPRPERLQPETGS